MLRYCIVGGGQRLSCGRGQYACQRARDGDVIVVLVFVYAAQKKDTAVHSGRGVSGRYASLNWLDSSIWQVELRGMGTLCGAFLMAVPTLHGHRLDVPGGLRSRRLPGAASRRR